MNFYTRRLLDRARRAGVIRCQCQQCDRRTTPVITEQHQRPRLVRMHVEAEHLDRLRTRTSSKWIRYDHDTLPLPVAEMDYPLAPAIKQALHDAVERNDTGYNAGSGQVAAAFAGFAERHWGWQVDPANVKVTADVAMGIVELLRMVTQPGDGVVICPPVYHPFFILPPEAGCTNVEVPLIGSTADGWAMDFAGIDAAFAAGARAIVLCSPHNPIGRVWTAEELSELVAIAAKHDAWIIADEIHGPLTFAEAEFVPILTLPGAGDHALSITSASKSFNIAGLKCAHMVAGAARGKQILDALPLEVEWRAALFGAIGNVAAFTEGDEWLAGVLQQLDHNRRLIAELLAEHLPLAKYSIPEATYLAWVDLSAYPELGDNPAALALSKAKVAFGIGPDFGAAGKGHIRINFACSPEVLTEAVTRLTALVS